MTAGTPDDPLHAELDSLRVPDLRASRGNKWTRYGPDVLPAWVADMDFPPPAPVRDWLRERVERGDLGYPPRADADPLPAAFAAWASARYGWRPDPGHAEILTDVVQGLYLAMLAYAGPGEGVVVQTPIYPPILTAVADTGRRLVANPLGRTATGFVPDLDGLRACVDRSTRVLVLCNPHNPSGRVMRREELEALAELSLERDLVVLADEIHADLTLDGRAHIPFASLGPEIARRVVTFHSATKTFNIAGLRAAVALFGSAELERRFDAVVPRRVRGGLGALASGAACVAWERGAAWLESVRRYLEANRARLAERIAGDLRGIAWRPPQATYLAWLDCRGLDLAPSPHEFFLREARVALSDGRDFGPEGEGFVRLNFATSRAILDEILDRMAGALAGRVG